LAAQSPSALKTNLKLMVAGSSLPEVIGIFAGAQSFMPALQFEQMTEYAATFVEPERWSAVEARLRGDRIEKRLEGARDAGLD
ncbi:MAG TPA: hypothetical protein VEH08_01440, partial [Methanomassiliicoccales archaeon]|nr:hypothetical protein [Methanomassiliicoccales archaeon]